MKQNIQEFWFCIQKKEISLTGERLSGSAELSVTNPWHPYIFPLYSLQAEFYHGPSLRSIPGVKHHDQKQVGEERVYFSTHSHP